MEHSNLCRNGAWLTSWVLRTPILLSICFLLLAAGNVSATPRRGSGITFSSRAVEKRELRTDQVTFDNYSLFLRGQRVFLHSGEFHTFRLPVPDLWPDILEKIKATGMNGISVYLHMGLINPTPGVVDLTGFRALEPLFEAAKAAGIWIVLRPGPYINAETTAGGIAHWITTEVPGLLRTNATTYFEAWQDYIHGIIDATVPYQITRGGPVIAVQVDNEYSQSPIEHAEYFVQLENAYHASEIVVPLTYNDPGAGRSFINGTGAVDLYGFDAYPQRYDCSHPDIWHPVPTNWHSYHETNNPFQPWYVPEYQHGSFDAWGPTSPGYEGCRELTGPESCNVFNQALWASNAKLTNYYMFYGGTSWGGIPFHGVYTSYDYGGSITESRQLTTKYDEIKRQGLFLRSSPEFYKTDWIADDSTGPAASNNPNAFVTFLQNPDTKTGFYFVRQNDSTSTAITPFQLTAETSLGSLQIPLLLPTIILGGREMKIIATDYTFGASSKILYSTTQIFFAGVIDGRDVLFLHGKPDQDHETALYLTGNSDGSNVARSPAVKVTQGHDKLSTAVTIVNFPANTTTGFHTVWDSDTQLVLYADSTTAATFWSPVLAGDKKDPLANFWGLGTNSSVLVGGPYLVRDAKLTGSTLALRGDLEADVQLTVIGPQSVKKITWNGEHVNMDKGVTAHGGFQGNLKARNDVLAKVAPGIPKLEGWKYKNNLPEIEKGFDDKSWAIANHTTTNILGAPYYGDGRILYGCDYGFCENVVLWRGHFNCTGMEKSVNLSINGGEAFAASVWINDVFLGTSFGNSTNNAHIIEETDDKFFFPPGSLIPGQDNVITIVQDNMGLNETGYGSTDTPKCPRGIRGFLLDNNKFGDWKVQGKIGGYKNFPDKTRGILNEGGLFAERSGWHLPGFSTKNWESRSPSDGLPNNAAGVGFFVTTFKLDIPKGLDAMLSFTFSEPQGQPYRAILFVNGWMMGKRVGNLGPQAKFPVHQGILDYQGENTVALTLWSMLPNVTVAPKLDLTLDAVYDGGVGNVETNNPVWSAKGRE